MNGQLSLMIGSALATETDAETALFYGDHWRSWGWLAKSATAIGEAIAGVSTAGLIARNRPHHIAALAGAVCRGVSTTMLYAAQSPAALAENIRALRLPAILAEAQDWTEPCLAAAREAGSAAIVIADGIDRADVRIMSAGQSAISKSSNIAVTLLSSGTTGMPKQIGLTWDCVTQAVVGTAAAYAGTGTDAPQIMVHPLGSVSGLAYALPPVAFRRKLVLLDKFEPLVWAAAVRDHRPQRGTVPPAGIRMLMEEEFPAKWLESLELIAVGGARLDPELHDGFEARFSVPLLTAYGATEFAGVVAGWSLDLYRQFGNAKRGSAGRAFSGSQLRIIDPESFAPLLSNGIGMLEVQTNRMGTEWIRTNDLAAVDADGFLFLHGRADDAINRGGFKIVPDVIAALLRSYPAVADVSVVGMPDQRLGEVPVAAVELRAGHSATPRELTDFLKDRLVAYQVPVDLRIVPVLPRNASMKVSLLDVKALFA